jgi:chromosome segregation ATPase
MDVLRRTASAVGSEGDAAQPTLGLDDAALWNAEEQALRSIQESSQRAERLAAAVARQRGSIDGAAERANLVAARAEGLSANAARVTESFERLGVVALNAGLEGARLNEPQGRALLLLSEEIRANVRRGADSAEQLARVVEEIAGEAIEVRRQLERSRTEVSDVGQEAAQLQAAAQQATRSIEDLGSRLRRATGVDPEVARAVAVASEHARGLMTALTTLTMAAKEARVMGALKPVIGPLVRLLREIEGGEDEKTDGGA